MLVALSCQSLIALSARRTVSLTGLIGFSNPTNLSTDTHPPEMASEDPIRCLSLSCISILIGAQ